MTTPNILATSTSVDSAPRYSILVAATPDEIAAAQRLRHLGRSCVHPDHRGGAVINLMWTGIARYLHLHGYRWLAGSASVPATDDVVRPLGAAVAPYDRSHAG